MWRAPTKIRRPTWPTCILEILIYLYERNPSAASDILEINICLPVDKQNAQNAQGNYLEVWGNILYFFKLLRILLGHSRVGLGPANYPSEDQVAIFRAGKLHVQGNYQ